MIRAASAEDARALAEIEARAWLRAYQDVVPPERLLLDVDEQTARFADVIARGERELAVLEVAGRPAGYVSVGPPKLEGAEPRTGELHSLYVDPPAQGAGVGTQLHDHALLRLAALGFADALLWTFRDNGHARSFYEHAGWELDPAARAPEHWMAPAVRYRRAL